MQQTVPLYHRTQYLVFGKILRTSQQTTSDKHFTILPQYFYYRHDLDFCSNFQGDKKLGEAIIYICIQAPS